MSNIFSSKYDKVSENWLPTLWTPGRLYTLGGVQSKQVDEYSPESDSWASFFPSLRHCRVAHGVVAVAESNTIFVAGGSAKAEI